MQFSNPYILWGLVLLAVPIIIHLFNFRRYRKVYFTNVRQLQEITIKTRRNARLRNLLILLLRMLATAALVIIFAGPYKVDKEKQTNAPSGRKIVSVFVDNSFSMELSDGNISLLELAKARALDVAAAYAASDRFQLITNNFSGKTQQLLSRESFIDEVHNITYSPVFRSTPEIVARQKRLLDTENGAKECYFISDFQKNTLIPEQMDIDSSYRVILMPLFTEKHPNIAIDSCWFETPTHRTGEPNRLFVKIRGRGNEALQKLPIRLMVNNKQSGLGNFDLAPDGEIVTEILFTVHEQGTHHAWVEISDYPVTFDDKMFFTFAITNKIGVAELSDNPRQNYLQTLFGSDEAFQYEKIDVKRIDYSLFNQYSLIVLSNSDDVSSGLASSLEQFAAEGGSIAVYPSTNAKDDSFKELFRKFEIPLDGLQLDTSLLRFGSLNLNSDFFADVFERMPKNMEMPSASQHYHLLSPIGSETLIQFENNDPALIKIPYKKGKIFLFTFPLNEKYTSFPHQALFVPTMLRMAFTSVQSNPMYYVIGEDEMLSVRNFALVNDVAPNVIAETGTSFIPGVRESQGQYIFYMHDNILNAGFYTVASALDSLHIAYNYDRKESELECFTKSEIEQQIHNKGFKNITVWRESGIPIAKAIAELYQGVPLWRWFILVVLLSLLLEGIIIRFWK
ncbi:MAG: BatA domain-containing protein [Bacteroidales bacterium]|nr:BatA domain-containing protein [Bacteroidales bacterium]